MATPLDVQTRPVVDEDRGYAGSRYPDVVAAIFANPYQRIWGGAGEPALPVYEVTFTSVFGGLIFGATRQFLADSERTLDSGADLRWGRDRKGFPRLVHPNGVCLTGRWQITEDTPYSGYFRKDSTALIVGRYSIEGADLDFRDEIMVQIFDHGDPLPKRTLTFDIEVTDDGESSGPGARLCWTLRNWRRIGALVFDNAVISHNGDRVIHFNHPIWREDRYDPSTATRVDGKKVR